MIATARRLSHTGARPLALPVRRRRRRGVRALRQRQPDRHRRALAGRALDLDRAVVRLHDRAGDRQPQPRAAGRPRPRGVASDEPIHHPAAAAPARSRCRCPRPGRSPAGRPCSSRSAICPAGRREAQRVRRQVQQHLLQAVRVGHHRRRALDPRPRSPGRSPAGASGPRPPPAAAPGRPGPGGAAARRPAATASAGRPPAARAGRSRGSSCPASAGPWTDRPGPPPSGASRPSRRAPSAASAARGRRPRRTGAARPPSRPADRASCRTRSRARRSRRASSAAAARPACPLAIARAAWITRSSGRSASRVARSPSAADHHDSDSDARPPAATSSRAWTASISSSERASTSAPRSCPRGRCSGTASSSVRWSSCRTIDDRSPPASARATCSGGGSGHGSSSSYVCVACDQVPARVEDQHAAVRAAQAIARRTTRRAADVNGGRPPVRAARLPVAAPTLQGRACRPARRWPGAAVIGRRAAVLGQHPHLVAHVLGGQPDQRAVELGQEDRARAPPASPRGRRRSAPSAASGSARCAGRGERPCSSPGTVG